MYILPTYRLFKMYNFLRHSSPFFPLSPFSSPSILVQPLQFVYFLFLSSPKSRWFCIQQDIGSKAKGLLESFTRFHWRGFPGWNLFMLCTLHRQRPLQAVLQIYLFFIIIFLNYLLGTQYYWNKYLFL